MIKDSLFFSIMSALKWTLIGIVIVWAILDDGFHAFLTTPVTEMTFSGLFLCIYFVIQFDRFLTNFLKD
jgi:hypothetical protein